MYTADNDAERCMIVARVCLGDTYLSKHRIDNATMPPDRADRQTKLPYKSVTGEVRKSGGILDHREYIIYSPGQAMPCYVIWYKPKV